MPVTLTCLHCGEDFTEYPGRAAQRVYCSYPCAQAAQRCPALRDTEWLRQRYVVDRLSASTIGALVGTSYSAVFAALRRAGIVVRTNARGPAHPAFKGSIFSNGYRLVYCPEHPHARQDGYVPEHRLVLEKTLGRYLRADEVGHHLNHNLADNRPENLIVMTRAAHTSHHHRGAVLPRPRAGRWALAYSACIRCGRTDRVHNSRGRCVACANRERVQR